MSVFGRDTEAEFPLTVIGRRFRLFNIDLHFVGAADDGVFGVDHWSRVTPDRVNAAAAQRGLKIGEAGDSQQPQKRQAMRSNASWRR